MTEHEDGFGPELSIIIPTRNRAAVLHDALQSLIVACAKREKVIECLVVDNGSTDETCSIVNTFSVSAPFSVRYIFEPCPGLHVGRNLGAVLARGDILVYLDDDVLVQPGWADAILTRFSNSPAIMIAGGPCLPQWEVPPPNWIDDFREVLPDNGWVLSNLSLIYQGDIPKPVTGQYIFGGNFAIRRNVVLESGGFHPDGMPPHLLHFRGDGETDMGMRVDAHPEYTVFYDPKIAVLHRIPATRMTEEHFVGVASRSGIGVAYSAFRASNSSLKSITMQWVRLTRALFRAKRKAVKHRVKKLFQKPGANYSPINTTTLNAIAAWQTYRHYIRICFSPVLRSWVSQPSYLPGSPCPYRVPSPSRTSMTEQIKHANAILAIIIRASFHADGIHFLTPDSFSQQLGYMKRPAAYSIAPHDHNPVPRVIEWTQEVLFIKSGKARLDLYAPESREYLESRILEAGDVVLLAHGGHGLVMLEESEIIEVKQGPYAGEADKTRFSEVAENAVVIKGQEGC